LHYDPLLAKLICWGSDRPEALGRLARALDEYVVAGIQTNLPFFRRLVRQPEFARGEVDTELLDRMLTEPSKAPPEPALVEAAAVAAVLGELSQPAAAGQPVTNGIGSRPQLSRWKHAGREQALRRSLRPTRR
jgi:acetyl/propionyl-CoA carboxylase alpha subunit